MSNPSSFIVTTDWLAQQAPSDNLVILDATFTLPGATPTAAELYTQRHLPGARFFDIDEFATEDSTLPHMLPSPKRGAALLARLGIAPTSEVIVYDTPGYMSAPRAWWTLRLFGVENVRILDGGLRKWQSEGRSLTSQEPQWEPTQAGQIQPVEGVRSREQLLANLESGHAQVIDARSSARFEGSEEEKRPGVRAGHIPASLNLPFDHLSDPATGELLSPQALRDAFDEAGIDWHRPVISSCGSGVTACVLAFALATLGKTDVTLYDGSWAEWGADPGLPLAIGKPGKEATA